MGAGQVGERERERERPHLLQPEAPDKGVPDKGGKCPMCDSKLHYFSMYVRQEAVTGEEAAPKRR